MRKEKIKKKVTGLDDERGIGYIKLKEEAQHREHETIGGLDLPEGRELKEENSKK